MLQFLPDIYIYTDHVTGANSGKSPGFGLTLTAETTTGVMLSAEYCNGHVAEQRAVPEDVAERAAHLMMEEIFRGGCCDSLSQVNKKMEEVISYTYQIYHTPTLILLSLKLKS